MTQQSISNMIRLVIVALTFAFLLGCSAKGVTQTIQPTPLAKSQQETPSTSLSTKTYVNSKHSFTFMYPRVLERTKKYQEDDGMYFMNDEASLLIWGSNQTVDHTTQLRVEGIVALHDSYTVRTFDKNDMRYCYGSRQKKDTLIQFQFTYPLHLSDSYEPLAQRLIAEISE